MRRLGRLIFSSRIMIWQSWRNRIQSTGFSGIHDSALVGAEVTRYGDSSCCGLAEGIRVKTQVISLRNELQLMSLEGLGTNNIVKPVLSNEEETSHRIPQNIRASLSLFYRLSIEFNVNSHRFRA